jgi:hypothetical protein
MNLVEIIEFFSNPLFTIIITGSISILGTYLAAIQKFRKDLESEFDKELRKERISAYMKLWQKLKLLSLTHTDKIQISADKNLINKLWNYIKKLSLTNENNKEIRPLRIVRYKNLGKLMLNMHDWYYESGIFLSASSRDNYFNLKNAIIAELDFIKIDLLKYIEMDPKYMQNEDVKGKLRMELLPERQKKVLEKASELRKSLANDIGARRENKLLSKREKRKI